MWQLAEEPLCGSLGDDGSDESVISSMSEWDEADLGDFFLLNACLKELRSCRGGGDRRRDGEPATPRSSHTAERERRGCAGRREEEDSCEEVHREKYFLVDFPFKELAQVSYKQCSGRGSVGEERTDTKVAAEDRRKRTEVSDLEKVRLVSFIARSALSLPHRPAT
ncbi:hypothetical protein EYF80_030831 [Liparis tanakae]|uniref:Uncharacterized protein n=1 Tax=Liparis tanakae TaxID=230148 RepID=A0A4Z2GZ91_9TELE|nr:hypothetical protein EYF80_030831 [Liparis tanakae]